MQIHLRVITAHGLSILHLGVQISERSLLQWVQEEKKLDATALIWLSQHPTMCIQAYANIYLNSQPT